jgi:hypothetical protein
VKNAEEVGNIISNENGVKNATNAVYFELARIKLNNRIKSIGKSLNLSDNSINDSTIDINVTNEAVSNHNGKDNYTMHYNVLVEK